MGITHSIGTLLDFILGIYGWMILVRVLLSWVNPDPYNPIVQFLVRATEPVLEPFRRLIPSIGGLDISPVVALMAVHFVQRLTGTLFQGGMGSGVSSLMAELLTLLHLFLTLYLLMLFARSGFHIHAWYTFHHKRSPPRIDLRQPLIHFIFQMTEPAIRPLRRWVPTVSGMEITPMVAAGLLLILLSFLQELALGFTTPYPVMH